MARYQVLEDCYGFKNRYWEKGEIVELNPEDKPPHHFKRIDVEKKAAAAASTGEAKPAAMSRKEMIAEAKSPHRRKLTEKQKNFIKAFLRKLQGTKAVVEAYPEVKNRNTAGVMAYELRRNPKIKKIIDEQLNKGNCACDFVDFEVIEQPKEC